MPCRAEPPDLTLREAGFLAGVSEGTIERALEAGVLKTVAAPARVRGGVDGRGGSVDI